VGADGDRGNHRIRCCGDPRHGVGSPSISLTQSRSQQEAQNGGQVYKQVRGVKTS
jgi:hypothetical protein